MKIKVLITGGAGFIGSNFVKYLLNNHEETEIVNLDLLSYAGRKQNIQNFIDNPRHKFIQGDIRNQETVESIIRENDINVIVNMAAETHVDRSIVEPGSFVLTDVYGTYILLDSARKLDVEKVICISTDEVYGSIEQGSFSENDVLSPSSPYSASKLGSEAMTKSFHKTYGLKVCITRSSNNYGFNQYPEKLIPKLILRAIHNKFLPLYGDGKQERDWLHVQDNCEAIALVMEKGDAGEIYNIAANSERDNLEIARLILKFLKKPESLIKFVEDRPGHDRRYSIETTKIKNLGWSPKIDFEYGLKETIEWYYQNEWWWTPLLNDEFYILDTPWKDKNKK